jgi:hypothetical protein
MVNPTETDRRTTTMIDKLLLDNQPIGCLTRRDGAWALA